MGKKEYYTFADLIIKLRDYYQEVQWILKEMEKCILIQTRGAACASRRRNAGGAEKRNDSCFY